MTNAVKNWYWKYIDSKVFSYLNWEAEKELGHLQFINGIAEGLPKLKPTIKTLLLCFMFGYDNTGTKRK